MTDFKTFDTSKVDWGKGDGFIPAVVQDASDLRVLMVGYMNREALEATIKTGFATFYSRSKRRLWKKGETSGHVLNVRDIYIDCDQDTLLVMADPQGPTCHNGTQSCFGDHHAPDFSILAELAKTIRARRYRPEPGSYTAKLFAEGVSRIAQKVGEEGVEVALAANGKLEPLAGEIADLVYHLSVLLEARDMRWVDVTKVLAARAKGKNDNRF